MSEKLFNNYPTQDDVNALKYEVDRDERSRSKVVSTFLDNVKDENEKRFWKIVCNPLLREPDIR